MASSPSAQLLAQQTLQQVPPELLNMVTDILQADAQCQFATHLYKKLLGKLTQDEYSELDTKFFCTLEKTFPDTQEKCLLIANEQSSIAETSLEGTYGCEKLKQVCNAGLYMASTCTQVVAKRAEGSRNEILIKDECQRCSNCGMHLLPVVQLPLQPIATTCP